MYAALADAPVVFEDIEHETRFKSSHLRNFHGVRGGAAVVIPTASGVFGVLVAYSSVQRTFADYEVAFLKSAANLLGEAVERSHTEQALRKSESRLKQLIASTFDAVFTVDRGGIVIEWNPQADATFGFARESRWSARPLPPDLRELFDSALASTTRRLETHRHAARTAKSSRSR